MVPKTNVLTRALICPIWTSASLRGGGRRVAWFGGVFGTVFYAVADHLTRRFEYELDFGPETSADTMTNMAAPAPPTLCKARRLPTAPHGGSPRRPIGSSGRWLQRAGPRCSRPDAAKTPGQGGMDSWDYDQLIRPPPRLGRRASARGARPP